MKDSTLIHTKSNHSVTHIKNEILSHFQNSRQLAKRTVEEVWHTGRWLNELKEHIPHGQFMHWLKHAGIAQTTANRYMRVAAEYKLCQVGELVSVDDAIKKLLPPPDAQINQLVNFPHDEMPPATELTPAEKRLIEGDQLESTVALAGEQITELETQLAEKDKVLQHYETAGKVSEGFIQGRDVIEAGNEHIRQLKYSLNNCMEESATLKRELAGLKKLLKKKDAELEKLRSERDNAVDRYDEFVSKLRADFQSTDDQDYDIPGHAG